MSEQALSRKFFQKCKAITLCSSLAWVAQLVEHSPEEGGVSSSSLLPSTDDRPESVSFQAVVICSLGAGSKAGAGIQDEQSEDLYLRIQVSLTQKYK